MTNHARVPLCIARDPGALSEPASQEPAIGYVLALLAGYAA